MDFALTADPGTGPDYCAGMDMRPGTYLHIVLNNCKSIDPDTLSQYRTGIDKCQLADRCILLFCHFPIFHLRY